MACVVLLHSAYGLRPAVLDAADRLRRAGHQVDTPDLYDGHVYRAGHLFTDPRLPEFDDAAALAVWARAERFLSEPFVPVA